MKKPKSVESYIEENEKWREELYILRELILSTGLDEGIKWAFPVYMHKGKNVVGLAGFKSYFGIWFYQGATMKDNLGVLTNAQEGKTQAMRQWRFSNKEAINREAVLGYIIEAIENQIAGNVLKISRTKKPLVIPPELQKALDSNPTLAHHFEEFSLGNKRDFSEYITNAKRAGTKMRRLEKIIPMILQNIGLNDKYKK